MRLGSAQPAIAFSAAVAASLLSACAVHAHEDSPAPAPVPTVDAASALAAIRAALPAGSTITGQTEASVPDGWVTRDGGGFLVEVSNGFQRFRTWFLPKEWIGICPRLRDSVWRRHAFGIVVGEKWKSMTLCDDQDVAGSMSWKLGTPASLLNSGDWISRQIFGSRVPEVDALARNLVDAECVTADDRDGAIVSLLLLGVPAPSLFREAAARGSGETAEHCAWVLGQFPGKDTVETLSGVVSDVGSDDKCVKSAAMALERLADPASGPSLLKALDNVRWSEAATQVVNALGRIRCKDAGPLLLRRMRAEENPWYRAEYAEALASIRYEPAIPDLRAMSGDVVFTAEWYFGERDKQGLDRVAAVAPHRAAVALYRMTGEWGEPSGGVRLGLLPPRSPAMGKPIVVALLIENVGDADVDEIAILEGTAYVDGIALPHEATGYDGCFTLRPNELHAFERDLTKGITKPGRHRIRYEAEKAVSNEIEIEVAEAAK